MATRSFAGWWYKRDLIKLEPADNDLMLWLYLLGLVTFLIIVLRRVVRRQKPLSDKLESQKVALDNIYTGVAWVDQEGKLGSVNPALARALQIKQNQLIGRDWCDLFIAADREGVREAYRQMLLSGRETVEARGTRSNGTLARFEVLLVPVYDRKTHFIGHHCVAEDRTTERELKERVDELTHDPLGIS